MADWQPIDTAPRETGRPLLLYRYPYPRTVWKTKAQYPNDQLLIDVNGPALRRLIKIVKQPDNVSMYGVDKRLDQVLSPQQGNDLFNQLADMEMNGQLADMEINDVGETEAEKATEQGQPGDAAEREGAPGDEPEAPTTLASLLEGHWESYSDVFEGYWDDTRWRSAAGVPCEPTHWMPMPPLPLTFVGQ